MITKAIDLQSSYDVIVIGGGPAGAAVATLLQRQGHTCLVLNSTTFPRYHVGESLIPQTYDALERLGLLPAMQLSHFPVKHSVRFVGRSGTETNPFYFSETIEGKRAQTWQVKRSEFDEMCLEQTIEAGADVRMKARVSKVLFKGDRAVGAIIQLEGDDQPCTVRSQVVVDASGRATVIGRQLGLKEDVPQLDKASIWSYYRGGKRRKGIDAGETTVFMIKDCGWFWYIPLPDDLVSVGVVASPEYLFDESLDFEKSFVREVERCQPLLNLLKNACRVEQVHGLRKLAYLNRQVVGDGWVMVGDAAGFLDPIYSSGLFLALASAELAADCIHQSFEKDDFSADELGKFVRPLWDGVDVIWRLISAFYDPQFSFQKFVERFPQLRYALIDCLVGDVVGKDMSTFVEALAEMTTPPSRLK